MMIDNPKPEQMHLLQQLWQEAFADDDAFWKMFSIYGFSPNRCRCAMENDLVIAALYWFDCSFGGKTLAYLYGIATAKSHRGKGVCRDLLENTHEHLKNLGYAGTILVPADESLRKMYEKMGYRTCSWVSEFVCEADPEAVPLRKLQREEYRLLRRQFLPENPVVQEEVNLTFLEQMADFYVGEDFLVTVSRVEEFFAPELLGNTQSAPKILASLGQKRGTFRTPGGTQPFAMYHSLTDSPAPGYFGLAFD